jgi:ribosome-binding factor A
VASAIRQELAKMLLLELKDPALGGVVVTGARVSRDLRVAWISYELHDDSEAGRVRAAGGLRRAAPFMRSSLTRVLRMRFMPELRFEYDERARAAERIDRILEQAPRPGGDDDEEEEE